MKVRLKTISFKVMEFSCLTLEINIKVILKMVYMMVLENIKLFNKDHM